MFEIINCGWCIFENNFHIYRMANNIKYVTIFSKLILIIINIVISLILQRNLADFALVIFK